MLELNNVVKVYQAGDQSVHAVKGISVKFRKNEFVSILGASGCGKTTLLNIIGGLDKYTSGDLIIDGTSTKDYSAKDWDAYRNNSVGFVFQSYNLIQHINILNNVEMALTLSGIPITERKERAKKALIEVGLEDQIHKKPNQLSGGQMQRVAIARALVNNPEILLADEPTGALDTETSESIMKLIKKISKDRLVIMVTHNPEIAENYSSRIISLKDGKITEDTNPYSTSSARNNQIAEKKRTSMSFFTAINLSFKNLFSKKARTFMTAFAGSIGIIGVALVLAVSTGLNSYIDNMQSEMLSSYPITISETSYDMNAMYNIQSANLIEKYPELESLIVNTNNPFENMTVTNNITDDYINDIIEKIDKTYLNSISYDYGLDLNIYKYSETYKTYVSMYTEGGDDYGMSNGVWQKLLTNNEYINSQYDVIYGDYPTSANELMLIVDEYNQINYTTLASLGLYTDEDTESIPFESLIGQTYTAVFNDGLYTKDGDIFIKNTDFSSIDEEDFLELEIVGILRINPESNSSLLSTGIAYLSDLETLFLEKNNESELVEYAVANDDIIPFSSYTYTDYDDFLRSVGGKTIPGTIKIYASDFNGKDAILSILDNYNTTVDEEDQIQYVDLFGTIGDGLTQMVNIISWVLVAFAGIALLVSSVMIGIITYTSVVERTKEIGVLRSLGARKKDITRVFNAETLLLGLSSGILGVIVTLILTIPINIIATSLIGTAGFTAMLSSATIIVLILISCTLTVIAGLIPAKIASNKNPVEALRS